MIFLNLLLALAAHADLGPKPTVTFRWKDSAKFEAASMALLQCKDKDCQQAAEPLKLFGPQHFNCCEQGCYAMAYGFSDVQQLSGKMNGKKALSLPFKAKEFNSFFEISDSKDKIVLKELKTIPEEELGRIQGCR